MDAAQRLLLKAPPADLEKNLKAIREQLKDNVDAATALNEKYPLPFTVLDLNEDGEKPFLATRFNAVDDGKHRSPWTNNTYPLQEAAPTEKELTEEEVVVRRLERKINHVWDAYKNLYYGHDAVGSVYLRGAETGVFVGTFGIQKNCDAGSWNSIHYVTMDDVVDEKTCQYHVTSQVLMVLDRPTVNGKCIAKGQVEVSASLSKRGSKTYKVQKSQLEASHIENVGQLIESHEIDLRSQLERVGVPKTREIMDGLQAKKSSNVRPTVNPLMGMIMDSSLLKKKLAASSEGGGDDE